MVLEDFVTPMVISPLIIIEKFVIHLTLIHSILAVCEFMFCFVMCGLIMF